MKLQLLAFLLAIGLAAPVWTAPASQPAKKSPPARPSPVTELPSTIVVRPPPGASAKSPAPHVWRTIATPAASQPKATPKPTAASMPFRPGDLAGTASRDKPTSAGLGWNASSLAITVRHAIAGRPGVPAFRINVKGWPRGGRIAAHAMVNDKRVPLLPEDPPSRAGGDGKFTLVVAYETEGLAPGPCTVFLSGPEAGAHHVDLQIPKIVPQPDNAKPKLKFLALDPWTKEFEEADKKKRAAAQSMPSSRPVLRLEDFVKEKPPMRPGFSPLRTPPTMTPTTMTPRSR